MSQTNFQGTVSYSKISTYLTCPELYRKRYIDKRERTVNVSAVLEEPLIKGSLAHSMIEYFLGGLDKDDAAGVALHEWLDNVCHITPTTDRSFAEQGNGVEIEKLEKYAKEVGHLLLRCAAQYTAEDKIRTNKGDVPKDPLNYPPTEYKLAYQQANLYQYKTTIDNQAVRCNNSFKRMSLANIAAEAISYGYLFTIPEFVDNIVSIEKKLDEEPVGFYKDKYYWNGLLDTEYSTSEKSIIINDHKTEKNKRRPEDVAFDLQLNSYAAVRCEQTGSLADYIAITHLRTNEIIAATVSPDIVNLCMDYLEEVQQEIELQIETKGKDKEWLKKWPGKYGSPCFRRNWKSEALDSVCPYFIDCWPQYYEGIKDEVDDFFGLNQPPVFDDRDLF